MRKDLAAAEPVYRCATRPRAVKFYTARLSSAPTSGGVQDISQAFFHGGDTHLCDRRPRGRKPQEIVVSTYHALRYASSRLSSYLFSLKRPPVAPAGRRHSTFAPVASSAFTNACQVHVKAITRTFSSCAGDFVRQTGTRFVQRPAPTARNAPCLWAKRDGRYWARTSDLRLVEGSGKALHMSTFCGVSRAFACASLTPLTPV